MKIVWNFFNNISQTKKVSGVFSVPKALGISSNLFGIIQHTKKIFEIKQK